MKILTLTLFAAVACSVASGQPAVSSGQFMYIGTLDKKLLVIDENKEEVVDKIQLEGIPRTTELSWDGKKLFIFTTQMALETVDLVNRKSLGLFSLSDSRSRPRRFNGLAVDPTGRYLYTVMRNVVKDIDQYHIDPPQFVAIDVQDKKIVKAFPFPVDSRDGFAANATFKVSADGKLIYIFQEDILVFDLENFHQVDRIELGQPPYPGASPYQLAAGADPNDPPDVATNIFTAVDPIVHKGTLGLATINLKTRKVDYMPIGPALPSMGFRLAPDHKRGFSVMPVIGTGGNRLTEWWVWDIPNHTVIKKKQFESRPTFRFAVGGDGKHVYLYGAGSTLEIFDAATLESKKLIYLNEDTTTNLITIAHR